MTKAEEYAKSVKEYQERTAPVPPEFGDTAHIDEYGRLVIKGVAIFAERGALNLADWIYEHFT